MPTTQETLPHSSADAPEAPPLRLVFWESTAGCNLACVHCRRLDVSRELCQDDLTHDEAMGLVRSLKELGSPILVFSGGEPLMRPDLFELAREAKRIEIPTALATNGTIMDERVAARVVDAGFRRVSISFDGPDPATHDRFRGIEGAFESSIRGVRELRKQGMSVQINTTVARHNHEKLDELYQLALDLGVDALHVFMLVPVGCGVELPKSVMLEPGEYEKAMHWIYDRSLEGKMQLKATCAPHYFRILRQRAKEEGRPMPKAPPKGGHGGHPGGHPGGSMAAMTKGCLAGQAVCFVSHTGEVFPCGYLPVTSGNVKETPLPTIWRDSGIFADLRDESRLEGKCGVCEYARVCQGCRARAYAKTGSYLAEEPSCEYVPVRLR
ncbi:MAG: radical SAM protein [Phycisphaeraceae bacterium]